LLVHVRGNSVRIDIHVPGFYSQYVRLDRRSRLRDHLALQILRNARIVDFLGWGEVEVDLPFGDFEALKLLSQVDFRHVRSIKKSLNEINEINGVIEELKLYSVISRL